MRTVAMEILGHGKGRRMTRERCRYTRDLDKEKTGIGNFVKETLTIKKRETSKL